MVVLEYLLKIAMAIFYGDNVYFFFIVFNCINNSIIFVKELSESLVAILTDFFVNYHVLDRFQDSKSFEVNYYIFPVQYLAIQAYLGCI